MLKPYPKQPKAENLEYGKTINKIFLIKNKIKWIEPKLITSYDNITGNKSKYVFKGQFLGYSPTKVQIQLNLSSCRTPIGVPGFSWSYTGYKADLTPAGVLSHEVGHYIDFFDRLENVY